MQRVERVAHLEQLATKGGVGGRRQVELVAAVDQAVDDHTDLVEEFVLDLLVQLEFDRPLRGAADDPGLVDDAAVLDAGVEPDEHARGGADRGESDRQQRDP